jgi:hypothetical protein
MHAFKGEHSQGAKSVASRKHRFDRIANADLTFAKAAWFPQCLDRPNGFVGRP